MVVFIKRIGKGRYEVRSGFKLDSGYRTVGVLEETSTRIHAQALLIKWQGLGVFARA
jgi:hypothetical protein